MTYFSIPTVSQHSNPDAPAPIFELTRTLSLAKTRRSVKSCALQLHRQLFPLGRERSQLRAQVFGERRKSLGFGG